MDIFITDEDYERLTGVLSRLEPHDCDNPHCAICNEEVIKAAIRLLEAFADGQ